MRTRQILFASGSGVKLIWITKLMLAFQLRLFVAKIELVFGNVGCRMSVIIHIEAEEEEEAQEVTTDVLRCSPKPTRDVLGAMCQQIYIVQQCLKLERRVRIHSTVRHKFIIWP